MALLLERLASLVVAYEPLLMAILRAIFASPSKREKLKAIMAQHEKAETDEELGDAAKAWQDSIRS